MVGAYPACPNDDIENEIILTSILECGITTFVCLQQEYTHGVSERSWRNGLSLRPYIEDALEICQRKDRIGVVGAQDLKFLHHGIVDCGCTTDLSVLELSIDISNRLLAGEVIYLHCWGGHGRTGTVVAVVLGLLFGISAKEALTRTQLYHDLRVCSLNVPSPQTPQQRMQVERILNDVGKTKKYQDILPILPMVTQPMNSPKSLPSPRQFEEVV
jgi:hypothetical protein